MFKEDPRFEWSNWALTFCRGRQYFNISKINETWKNCPLGTGGGGGLAPRNPQMIMFIQIMQNNIIQLVNINKVYTHSHTDCLKTDRWAHQNFHQNKSPRPKIFRHWKFLLANTYQTYLVVCIFTVMDPQTLFHGSISGVWAVLDYWSPVLSFIIRLMQLSDSTPSWCIKQYQSNWASLLHDPAVINSLN